MKKEVCPQAKYLGEITSLGTATSTSFCGPFYAVFSSTRYATRHATRAVECARLTIIELTIIELLVLGEPQFIGVWLY